MTWRETMPMNEQERKLQSKDGSSRRELIWPQVAEGSEPKALLWTLLQTRSWLTHKNNRLYLYEHEDVQKIRQESSCHRWKSDDTEIHRVASTCTPHACRGSQGIVSTSCAVFSCILSEDFTQENFTHNQNAGTGKSVTDLSHSSSLQRLISSNTALQLLRRYLHIPHISK